MAFTDKSLSCVDCGASFVFTARDQEFHASKGFANEPKRCFNCRQQRRVQRGDAPAGASSNGAAASMGMGGARPAGRQPVYSGPRASGTVARPSDRRGGPGGGRPRSGGGRRDSERGGRGESGAAIDQRSFDGGNSAPVSYSAPCTVCGNDTPVSANAGTQMVLCPDCYSKMTALASS